ncbi:MAG: helix-turn-helix transcriptional regulator [Hafnia sp.]
MNELNSANQTHKTKRKEFTQADVIANENLRELWATFRASHLRDTKETMTQEKAATLMDWTQSNFSQYLNGIVPIGFKAAQKLSILFGCKISDIRPDYRDINLGNEIDQKEEMKAMLSEMLDILSGMRTGETDTDTAHQKVVNLTQRLNSATTSADGISKNS